DERCRPLAFVLTPGQAADAEEARERFATAFEVACALLRPDGHLLVSAQGELWDEIKTAVGTTATFDMVEELCTHGLGAVYRQRPAVAMRHPAVQA
ncbi:hypothetical protein, partial [Catenulispora subtropica]|uniref:hypothetical protein n=1 Tax=Catenulispora subtropica TaxID=450798 RepID=UPI0031D69509